MSQNYGYGIPVKSSTKKNVIGFGVIVVFCFLVFCVLERNSASREECMMRAKYEAIELGCRLVEAERILGMKQGTTVISSETGQHIETLDEQFAPPAVSPCTGNCYPSQSNRFAVILDFEYKDERAYVVSKALIAIRHGTIAGRLKRFLRQRFDISW
jgi:hypothetical protein